MRIGSLLNNLFHRQDAHLGAPDAARSGLLSARFGAKVEPRQIRDLDSGLAAIRELPGGAVLLDALRAHTQVTGEQPRIILTHDRGRPDASHVTNGTWRVNPQALLDHPDKGLKVLARLYENLARPRSGRFHGIARERLPHPDPELQRHWQDWIPKGAPLERRFDAVRILWDWTQETSYYGGLGHDQMICMLDHIALNVPIPMNPYAELNLSGLSLRELPKMPPKTYALRADDNDLESLQRLPDDLRVLRLNRALGQQGQQNLSRQLQQLPSTLVELELDGNHLATIMQTPGIERWTPPRNLKSLSIRHNTLTGLPILQSGLTTLSASGNYLMNLSGRTIERATGLRKADFSHNYLSSISPAIQRLSRSCQVDLSGNPLTEIVHQIADREGLAFDAAHRRLPATVRRMGNPNIVYNAAREQTRAAPARIPAPAPAPAPVPVRDVPARHIAAPDIIHNPARQAPMPTPPQGPERVREIPVQYVGNANTHRNPARQEPTPAPARAQEIPVQYIGNANTHRSPARHEPTPAPAQAWEIPVQYTGNANIHRTPARQEPIPGPARAPAPVRQMPAPSSETGESELPTTANPAELEAEVGFWLGEKRMKAVAPSWRSIADQNGADYFVRMLQRLRLYSANRNNREFQESVAEYLTEFMRPERAELRTHTLAACQARTARCVDDATLAFVQLKMLRANDDVARGVYDQHPKELIELGEQLFVLDILTKEAVAKGNALSKNNEAYRQEFVETVLACYVHFRKKLGLTLVVPDMNYKSCSGLKMRDFDEIEAAVEKKRKEFPYYLNVEWEGWKNMLERNFADGYAQAESRRHDDLEKLDDNITLALRQKGWYADGVDVDADLDADMRHQEGLLVWRKMDYERMAPVTRAYLKSVGKDRLASRVAPWQAPAIDE